MPRQRLIAYALVAVIGSSPPCAAGFGEARAAATAQTSSQGGVKITVEPRGFPHGAKTWDFAITLETHTQTLDDDLALSSTLLAGGKPYRPLGWEGSPPGRAPSQGRVALRGGDAVAAWGGIADSPDRRSQPKNLPLAAGPAPLGEAKGWTSFDERNAPWQPIPCAA